MGLVLKRSECRELKELRNWVLIYGRRKTGKTTLVRDCVKYDYYVVIGYGDMALVEDSIVKIDTALREAKAILQGRGCSHR